MSAQSTTAQGAVVGLHAVPVVEPAKALPEPIPPRDPVQLQSIPWGTRDPALALVVLRHLAAVNAVVIPFNPLTHSRVCAWLRSHGIHH